MPKKPKDSPRIPQDIKGFLNASGRVKLSPEREKALAGWIEDSMSQLLTKKTEKMERIRRWREILRGKNPDPPPKQGISNVSVPLIMWVRGAAHTRLFRGVFGQRPFVKAEPAGKSKVGDVDLKQAAKALAKLLEALITNPRELDGRRTVQRVAADMTDVGLGAWIVREIPTEPLKVADPRADGGYRWDVRLRRVRWQPIAFEHLIAFDGYGPDANAMPFVGHKFRKTWSDLTTWSSLEYYNSERVAEVAEFYAEQSGELPASHRNHWIAELYLNYDVDGDNALEAVRVDWHVDACKVLGVFMNPFGAWRPIVMPPFDTPADAFELQGQGVPEKLESSQTEANQLHNIAIESGKRSINLCVVRANTALSKELGGDQIVIPSSVYITEDPERDLRVEALGDVRVSQFLLGFEELNQLYASRLMGIGDTQLGDVTAGKRVPAQLGLPIMREGRILIDNPLDNLAQAMVEACYLTLDALSRNVPERALMNILDEDEIRVLQALVFAPTAQNADNIRDRFAITIKARDIAVAQQAERQDLLILNQFLIQFYRDVAQVLMALGSGQVPPQVAPLLVELVEKMQNAVRELVRTVESIDDPSDVLMDVAGIRELLGTAGQLAGVTTQLGTPAPQGTPDLGGGVT